MLLHRWTASAIVALLPTIYRAAAQASFAASPPDRGGRLAFEQPDPTSIPGASSGANGEPTCRVEARAGYARLIPDGTPQASLVASSDASPSASGAVVPSLAEDQLPTGEAASELIVAAITATIEQVAACATPTGPGIVPATGEPDVVATPVGTPSSALPVADLGVDPILALYSDDYFRRDGVVTTGGIAYWAPPMPGTRSIRDVRVLSDGRVGAIVEGPGQPVFLVMVAADDGYLIDEVVVLTRVAGTPAP